MEIYIVEDSPLIFSRLSDMLDSLPGVIVLGHAAGADDAVREIVRWKPDLVVLDLELDQGNGFDVLRAVKAQAPQTDVYMFTNYIAEPIREQAKQLGASRFFDKTKDFEKLRDLIAQRARTLH
jgi:DNA-binding NarL/FixJ family response regulator